MEDASRIAPTLLDRLCAEILDECRALMDDASLTSLQRHLKTLKLIQQRDGGIDIAFDDMRRSMAILKLTAIRRMGLLTDAEFPRFSPKARETVDSLLASRG
ncbi:MAG: hypothetical protein AVDCRST_MAG89-3098 [uncultured Gemmatimonadetes bacterium]|uniref:Uncharacterized protein n=1 Tax=uncultured Gemmatimonadota bacterium TaxID=203437 RepID=A0A6J4M5L8_9BACT|nr:MAG: hypothetical protein AVDCRST_MAG89-3098 [uncultured Gemmatimonadota bacterium]